jgi:hypothetical protein
MKTKAWLLVLTLAAPLPPQAQAQLSKVSGELHANVTGSQAYNSLVSGAFELPVVGGETGKKLAAMSAQFTKNLGMEPPRPGSSASQSSPGGGKPQAQTGGCSPGGAGNPIFGFLDGLLKGVKSVVCGLFGCLFGKK